MKNLIKTICIVIITLSCTTINAQEKSSVKFGKISPEDFDLSKYNFDTSVNAVVIADIGSTVFETNSKGWFSLIFKHYKRVKILNKNGFDESNVQIPLYSNGTDEEKLINLKAATYNLDNGKVIKNELEGSSVFNDKLSKNFVNRKFAFPAVKEGSIIEYSYTIKSDFLFNLQSWTFQGEYPRIWSEYEVGFPDFFKYVTLSQGYGQFHLRDNSSRKETFTVMVDGGANANRYIPIETHVNDQRWVMKDVPALKEEPFTTTIDNHIAKIEFQLSQYRFPDMPVKDILGNWSTVSKEMLENENFGVPINRDNNWLDSDIKIVVAGAKTQLEKAKQIYAYVSNNFTCTDHSDIYLNNPLKTIFKNKNGSVSDINLLLIAMLRHENIEAHPVILSTRSHGLAHEIYPLMSRYNYVVAEVMIDGATIDLDASRPALGFGKLPLECYNGYARMIAKLPALLDFKPEVLTEKKLTTVFITPNEKGELEGSFTTNPGYYESYDIRKKIKEKGETEFFKKISTAYGSDVEIIKPHIDSLQNTEKPVTVQYDFKLNNTNENILYFNPMMSEGYKSNLFKAAERNYPVEMPFTFDETYVFNLEIPANYTLEELPKPAKVSFNDGEGYFEYLITKNGNTVQMRSRVMVKKANFPAEEYNSLREFFGFIVKKHGEQIVFKKK